VKARRRQSAVEAIPGVKAVDADLSVAPKDIAAI
jgi:hypothetical protein